MADPLRKVSQAHDAKGRLISIFVGAVLFPSLALSYVSVKFVPELAYKKRQEAKKAAEKSLYYVEQDLEKAAQARALEAGRAVGTERLLDGRPEVVREALREAELPPGMFESLRLEGYSLRVGPGRKHGPGMRDVLGEGERSSPSWGDEDSVLWPGEAGEPEGQGQGLLRFRFSDAYLKGTLLKEYFAREFVNAQSLVVRVADGAGQTVLETAPTPDHRFEVWRKMEVPTYRGMKLALRYRDHSIDQDVRRLELGTLALIGFIDLMLGAGLFLVYSNVRREMHLSRLKSDFVANVSHELKTPLALIRLFAETLELGRVPSEEKARQYYRVINKESQRLTQLINNILDFSRIEAGRREYHMSPTDVRQIVKDVLEAYRFPIEQQGFVLEVNLGEDVPPVEADKEALGQAVLNLMNNAIKYSRDEKYIRVDVARNGRSGRPITIAVTDRGIGIARSEQRKIFEKFYRAEDSLVHETKGSGLGLPLVQHIMEAHGGSVEVESVPGRGSTFTLVIPVRQNGGGATEVR